ncbi:hypothetical protein EGJ52_21425 [Pseudomonas luteola]|nr:hypothetical protein EGJ52_21425 [Pseudomonas luteola]RRW43133.1 hypothetical protein EGJ50_19065 [Pseudomonas luteola]
MNCTIGLALLTCFADFAAAMKTFFFIKAAIFYYAFRHVLVQLLHGARFSYKCRARRPGHGKR